MYPNLSQRLLRLGQPANKLTGCVLSLNNLPHIIIFDSLDHLSVWHAVMIY